MTSLGLGDVRFVGTVGALLLGSIAVATGCGGELSCEETQTCSTGASKGGSAGATGGTMAGGTSGSTAGHDGSAGKGGASSGGDAGELGVGGGAGGTSSGSGGKGGSSGKGGSGGTLSNAGDVGTGDTGGGGEAIGDGKAPRVVSVTPAADAFAEPLGPIALEFSEKVFAGPIMSGAVKLFDGTTEVSGSVSYGGAKGRTATFTPDARLNLLGQYTVKVSAAEVTDVDDGLAMEDDFSAPISVRDGVFLDAEVLADGNSGMPTVGIDAAGSALVALGVAADLSVTRHLAGVGWDGSTTVVGPCSDVGCSGSSDDVRLAVSPTGDAVAVYPVSDPSPGLQSIQLRNAQWATTPHTLDATCNTLQYVTAMSPVSEAHMICKVSGGFVPYHTDASNAWVRSGYSWSSSDDKVIFPLTLGFDAAGNGYAVWVNNGARYTRYNKSQGTWAVASTITGSGPTAQSPSVAVNATGNAMAVWSEGTKVIFSVYTLGSGWSTPSPLADGAGGVAIAAGDDFVVAWVNGVTGTTNVYANRYHGGAWSTPKTVSDGITETQTTYPVQLASDAAGNVLVVYRGAAGTYDGIFYNRYTVAAGGWGTPQAVTTSQTNYGYPSEQLVVAANGTAAVVMMSLIETSPGSVKVSPKVSFFE